LAFEEREKEIKKKLQVSQSIMVSLLFSTWISYCHKLIQINNH
jgi:hypothetical protein